MQPYFVEAVAESGPAGDQGELERHFCYAERACFAHVEGRAVAGPWRARIEQRLLRAGYSPWSSDGESFRYTRHGLAVATHARELQYLAQLGADATSPLRARKPTKPRFRTVVGGYADVVERVRASPFSPTSWRCAARMSAATVTTGGTTLHVVSAPLHDGWDEGNSVHVQVLTADRTPLPPGIRAAVQSALTEREYRRMRVKFPHPKSNIMFMRRNVSSPVACVREAARVLRQLTAVCAAW